MFSCTRLRLKGAALTFGPVCVKQVMESRHTKVKFRHRNKA